MFHLEEGGKGFLVCKPGYPPDASAFPREYPEVYWVDWEGKKKQIVLDECARDTDEKKTMLQASFLYAWRWEAKCALYTLGAERIRLDTEKHIGTFEAVAPAEVNQYEFANRVKVRGITEKFGFAPYRLEVAKKGSDKATDIVGQGAGYFTFSPSPNGKLVAIWCGHCGNSEPAPGREKPLLFVVDNSGDIVSRVELRVND
jgi:hypothetical protein